MKQAIDPRTYLSIFREGMKECTACGEVKAVGEFYRDKLKKDGLYSRCKKCHLATTHKHYVAHKEKYLEQGKQTRKANGNAAWWKWRRKNPELQKERSRAYTAKQRSTLMGRLNSRTQCNINMSLRKGAKAGRAWESIVGYTVDQLKKHLEKQFTTGMSWEAFMRGDIHIDHKTPKAAFNFQTPDDIDFRRCWELSNLRPMWARDNLKKGAKIDRPFQPSLAI
ncbi:MAG: hypothetical protein WC294_00275 [Methanoregula sp.]|jgi:hypothetical protein